jgi:hypothetical protein
MQRIWRFPVWLLLEIFLIFMIQSAKYVHLMKQAKNEQQAQEANPQPEKIPTETDKSD